MSDWLTVSIGGWDPKTGEYPEDLDAEIGQAFANVDLNLRDAGSTGGWKNVYRVNSYHVPLDDTVLAIMKKYFEKWMPDHQPIWTTIGVVNLGESSMRVEIEVVAQEPAGRQGYN